jgi:hypothetical protein
MILTPRRWRGRGWRLFGATCSTALLAGCGVAASGGALQQRDAKPQGASRAALAGVHRDVASNAFAGYIWFGNTSSIQASWTVPRIMPRSPAGGAGTWIGAQGPGTRLTGAFIQVGINETRYASSAGRQLDVYWAFWTDTAHHFLPINLFSVRPGDVLWASLAHRRGQWTVVIRDLSSGTGTVLTTRQEGRASFDWAEWEQEDVGLVGQPFHYPRLSAVSFRRLEVNGGPPAVAGLYSSWMTRAHERVVPSAVRGDSFTLSPGRALQSER